MSDILVTQKDSIKQSSFIDQKPLLLVVCLVVLFLLAGAVRLYNIKAPGLSIDREYTSAIFARAFYFSHTDTVDEWQKDIASITKQNQPILEPPITAYLVSLIYRVIGSEQLWVSHLLTSSFWLVGGIFLYKIAKIVVSTDGALFATAYYFFVPLGIRISRSFQPESLMMLLFLISLFCILKYFKKPRTISLLAAACISGLTLLYRPLVIFAIIGFFVALAIYRRNSWKGIFERDSLMFLTISLLPAFVYYGYGILVAGFLRWKVATSFYPHLFLHHEYWMGWMMLAVNGVGYLTLIAALVGLPLSRKGLPRAALMGLWIGYGVFGLIFNLHIHTHIYYHVQLIPIVALSLSPLVVLIMNYLRQSSNAWYWWLPVIGVMLMIMFFNIRNVRDTTRFEVLGSKPISSEIGEIVKHSSNTVYVARYFGLPLQYYGQLAGAFWPRKIDYWLYQKPGDRELSVQERIDALSFSPEFFVITDFNAYREHHTDLKNFLEENCALIAKSNQYLIYDGSCAR